VGKRELEKTMTYQITLLEADIRSPMDGAMVLGLNHKGEQKAKLEYSWDAESFTAIFRGHAPSLPIAAHPTTLLQASIAELYRCKSDAHQLITDVFLDHQISINPNK